MLPGSAKQAYSKNNNNTNYTSIGTHNLTHPHRDTGIDDSLLSDIISLSDSLPISKQKQLMPCPAFVVSNHTSTAPLSRSSTRLRQGTCATAKLSSYIVTYSNSSKSRRCTLTLNVKHQKIIRKYKTLGALLEMLKKYEKRKRNFSGFQRIPPPSRYLSRQSPLVCHVKSNGSAR